MSGIDDQKEKQKLGECEGQRGEENKQKKLSND